MPPTLRCDNNWASMNGEQFFDGFELHYHAVFHEYVETVARIFPLALVHDGERKLGSDFQALVSEFLDQTGLVSTLKQRGTKERMDLHGSRYD